MKMLFLCTSEFQLMTALNIKFHMHPNDDADIIVANYHGEERELAERIRKTKLFRKVFYVREYIENDTLHKYFHDLIEREPSIGFFCSIKNSFSFLKVKSMRAILGPQVYIKYMIADSSQLDLKEYDAFFAYGTKTITYNLADCVLKYNPDCHLNLLDEGIGSYADPEIGMYSDIIQKCYVYDVDMAIYEKEICKVPSIKREEYEFIDILDYIFQFNGEDKEDYRNAIIIFDQGNAGKMPRYLQNSSWWFKIIFHNAYTRHLKEENEFRERVRLIDAVIGLGTEHDVWMKLHPRSSKDTIREYKTKGIRVIRRYDLPWELIAVNCSVGNNILMTISSSSVCLYNAVIDGVDDNTQRILLYKMSDVKNPETNLQYFKKLGKGYKNIHIPQTMDELKSMISCFVSK